jgi:cytochrome c oxidase subunit 2
MLATVKSIPAREFDEWMGVAPEIPQGRDLLAAKGCIACHTLDGSKLIGPSFQGIWGRTETVVLPDGTKKEVVVDEDYVRQSVMDPASELVDGYQNLMPPQGALVNEEELKAIIEALKEL